MAKKKRVLVSLPGELWEQVEALIEPCPYDSRPAIFWRLLVLAREGATVLSKRNEGNTRCGKK